jgi:hypothetical protein
MSNSVTLYYVEEAQHLYIVLDASGKELRLVAEFAKTAEGKRDAYLMAAAPQLLKALLAASDLLIYTPNLGRWGEATHDLMKTAIANTKGPPSPKGEETK